MKRSRKRRAPIQRVMSFGRGGFRPGAGRKRSKHRRRKVPHRPRKVLASRYPVHCTLKIRRDVRSLRMKKRIQILRHAFVASCSKEHFRIIDWSVQGDHIHLIVEARDAQALARGMQGFSIRLARGLNTQLGRHGPVLAERYHSHILKTPREVRNARCYVMNNYRRHAAQRGEKLPPRWVDPWSSWVWFDGWGRGMSARQREARASPDKKRCAAKPKTWLLRVGWRLHGLVAINEIPGH